MNDFVQKKKNLELNTASHIDDCCKHARMASVWLGNPCLSWGYQQGSSHCAEMSISFHLPNTIVPSQWYLTEP